METFIAYLAVFSPALIVWLNMALALRSAEQRFETELRSLRDEMNDKLWRLRCEVRGIEIEEPADAT